MIHYVDNLDVFFFKGIRDRWGFNERLELDATSNGDAKQSNSPTFVFL